MLYHNAQTDTSGTASLPAHDIESAAISRRSVRWPVHVFSMLAHWVTLSFAETKVSNFTLRPN